MILIAGAVPVCKVAQAKGKIAALQMPQPH